MAPDKIYMTPSVEEPDSVLLASFSINHLDYHNDICYLRKDALLEWAKERLDFACALKSEGQKTVCKEFIDKLNSM